MDLVSASLLYLVAAQKQERPTELQQRRVPDGAVTGLVAADLLRPMVRRQLQGGGQDHFRELGRGLASVPFSPLLHLFDTAGSAAEFARRWQLLDGALALRHRTKTKMVSQHRLLAVRSARSGPIPEPEQNRLICAVFAGQLAAIGCRDVVIATPDGAGRWHEIALQGDGADEALAAPGACFDRWELSWSRESAPHPGGKARPLASERLVDATGTLRSVVAAIAPDLSHRWLVANLAERARLSRRTLERRLNRFGLRLPELVRAMRIRQACLWMQDAKRPVTAIAHELGFADAAHFSRSFRQAAGVSPQAYRLILGD